MESRLELGKSAESGARNIGRSVLVFYGVALTLATITPTVMWLCGWDVMGGAGGALVILTMWAPAVGRYVATRTVDRDWVSPLPVRRWGRPRGWVFGWPLLCILIIYAAAYGVGIMVGWSEWAPKWGGPAKIAVNLAFNVPVVIAIGLFGSIGEELGWRGYLQPRLDQAGVRSIFPMMALMGIFHLDRWGQEQVDSDAGVENRTEPRPAP